MTGFERPATFVIRRAKHTPEGRGPPLVTKAMSRNYYNLMSFPIEQVRLNSLSSFDCIANICFYFE